jgi:hypothetical protein
MLYNPKDWYWVHRDGATVYSTARNAEVSASDAHYAAWLDAGNEPTPYPCDANGNESREELGAVLAPFGLRVYPLSAQESILSAMSALEAKQSPRMLRGAALGFAEDIAMLQEIERDIAGLREELQGLAEPEPGAGDAA